MRIQDILFSIGDVVFLLALLPSIMTEEKPNPNTSLITGTVLLMFTALYASLALPMSATTSALNAVGWFILAAQEWKRHRWIVKIHQALPWTKEIV